eukprot:s76_g29.t1
MCLSKQRRRLCSLPTVENSNAVRTRAVGADTDDMLRLKKWCWVKTQDTLPTGAQTMATLLLKTTTLTTVDLSANDISSKGMNFILRTMLINRSVKALDLSSKTGSNRNRFSKLNAGPLEDLLLRNSTLQRLSLSTCTLGAVGAQGLSRGLVGNQSLKFLDVSQNDLGDKGACYIASVLKECALEELNLADNNICDEGLISLACSLGSLPNKMDSSSPVWSRAMEATKAAAAYADSVTFLRKTVLDADEKALWPEEGSKGSAEEIKDAAKALQLAVKAAEVTLPKLKILNLTNNSATSIGVRCVADALQANNVLERLSLDHCDHRDPDNGYYSLIVSLPVNSTLRHLGLSYALLGPNGLIHLAKVVATNEVLCSLNLSGNLVDEKSASAWKITLGGNRSLKSLGMAACHIDDTAGVILAEGIGRNQGLEFFSLRDNALRNSSAEAFEEALLQNGHLVQLNLELNSIHLRFLGKIKQLLDRNNKIRDKGLPDRYRTRIAELTECQKEVGRMSQVLMRNRQKKRVALWKQAAKVFGGSRGGGGPAAAAFTGEVPQTARGEGHRRPPVKEEEEASVKEEKKPKRRQRSAESAHRDRKRSRRSHSGRGRSRRRERHLASPVRPEGVKREREASPKILSPDVRGNPALLFQEALPDRLLLGRHQAEVLVALLRLGRVTGLFLHLQLQREAGGLGLLGPTDQRPTDHADQNQPLDSDQPPGEEVVSAAKLTLQQCPELDAIEVIKGSYWEAEVKAVLKVQEAVIKQGEIYLKAQVMGTQNEALLRAATTRPDRWWKRICVQRVALEDPTSKE